MSSIGSSSTASCPCRNCPQNLLILLDSSSSLEFVDFVSYHAANYRQENPHIAITVQPSLDLENKLLSSNDWDASIFPAQLVGSLVDNDVLWDLGPFVDTSKTLEWTEILPFFRGVSAVYHEEINGADDRTVTRMIPLDGDLVSMYYRRDLFEQYNVTIPRTWAEYNQAAAFFHGKPLGPDGSPLFGSCVSRSNECNNEYWISLILASMTQTLGTSTGFLLDPSTMQTLLGPAMEETLQIMREQLQHGHEDELGGDCRQSNFAFNQGKCALTYNWGEQITMSSAFVGEVAVAPTPGSTIVLDRNTRKLVNCTESRCPYGTFYEDLGIVNRPSYAARGGWMSGINSKSSESQKYGAADFLAYISNSRESLYDILPNARSSFAQPYRYSHTDISRWVNRGFEPSMITSYTETIQQINSDNSVLELRVASGDRMRDALDQEVFDYLVESLVRELTPDEDSILRRQTTRRMEKRIQSILRAGERVSGGVRLSESYQLSIGHSHATDQELKNYINESFRDAAWGLSGLMCVIALSLMMWTFRQRNNRVMQAFQPFLLIQSCFGLMLMSSSIIPLGFDDSLHTTGVLNVTCMIAPWLYVVGFTLFFSSVYSKIKECIKIYRDPRKCEILLVKPESCLRLTVRLLILNGVLLALWTGTDPLTWKRLEVDGGIALDDGTVETYGACRGGDVSPGFALALYALNMVMVLIASIQAFKCRFLVLEYNEMQWLPLSVFPFFEVWIIGGPILPLFQEDATVTFVLLSMMIVVSTGVGGMAVFAPKDWYIRKFHHANPKRNPGFPERRSSSGIMVLQHPTVENQKQIEALSAKVGQIEGLNTELEIEIRMTKERFKELNKTEMLLLRESLLHEALTDTDKPADRSMVAVDDLEHAVEDLDHTVSNADEDDLAALEHFQRVWKMADDDDEDENQLESEPIPKSSPLNGQHSMGIAGYQLAESAPIYKKHLFPLQNQDSGSHTSSTRPDDPPLMRLEDDYESESEPYDHKYAYDANDGPMDPLAQVAQMEHAKSSSQQVEDDENGRRPAVDNEYWHQQPDDDDYSHQPSENDAYSHRQAVDDKYHQQHPEEEDYNHQQPEDDDYSHQQLEDDAIHQHLDDDSSHEQVEGDSSHQHLQGSGYTLQFPDPDDSSYQRQQDSEYSHEQQDDEYSHQHQQDSEYSHQQQYDDEDSDDDREYDDYNDSQPDDESEHNQRYTQLVSGTPSQNVGGQRKKDPAPPVANDEELTEQELISQIIALRLAAVDAGDVNNESTRTSPEDPLERLMKMCADDPKDTSGNGKKRPSIVLGFDEQEREKALIARIIALRLAAADKDGEEFDDASGNIPEDPLERIMSMNAEDRLIAAVTLEHFEDPSEHENDEEDEDAIVHQKDIRDLSYMIQENDLDELERKAAMIAASVKAKLADSNLADLSHSTERMFDDSDSGSRAYLALATGGNKDFTNTSNIMGGLDVSKISDDGDRRFVSMSDSILDSPGRAGQSNGYMPSLLLGNDSADDSRHSGQLRAGQSSGMDPATRKGLSNAAAAALYIDNGYATQFAGEPSQGESGRRGLGFHANGGKEMIGDVPYRSPFTQGKRPVTLRSPDSPFQNKSYSISDWAAVGGLANVLADISDSQSGTSYTGSAYAESSAQDSESSFEATTRPLSDFEPLVANDLDQLVGTLDWEGIKATSTHRYNSPFTNPPPVTDRRPSHNRYDADASALEEKRRKKRELEAEAEIWRESISKSFTK